MFNFIKKHKVLLFTTSTINNFAMENNNKNIIKNDNLQNNNCYQNINNDNTFINSDLVNNAFYNGFDIKHNKTKFMPINKYICVNYDFTKKIVTKSTANGNCLFNLLSSLIFNTEKYNYILRLFLCDKLEKDKEMKELGEKYLKDYINKMEQNCVFGEYTIVNIFSKIFNIPVQIIDTSNNKYYNINYDKNSINYLKLYYNGINHYNYGISTLNNQQMEPIVFALKNFITYLKNKNKAELDINLNCSKNEYKYEKGENKCLNEDKVKDNKNDKNIYDKNDKIKDNKDNKNEDNKDNNKYNIIIEPVKENKTTSNLYNLLKKNLLTYNNICNQSSITLLMIGLLLCDIYITFNDKNLLKK